MVEVLAAAAAGAVASFAQARCCAGFRVGGLFCACCNHVACSAGACGVFTWDATDPDANGRPHWSTAEGGHLYYSINGNWCLNADGLTPDKDGATAWISRAGAVPVGEVVWQYYNDCKIVEQRLAVAKLLPAEAARLRIVGDDASEIRWWEIDGGDVDHLSASLVRRAVYGPWPSCTTISLLKT